jgi:hypothetical protein
MRKRWFLIAVTAYVLWLVAAYWWRLQGSKMSSADLTGRG